MVRQTSIDVYHQIQDEGLLSKQRFNTYHILFHHGPMTASELAVKARGIYGDTVQNPYHKRLPELRDMGVVKELGTTVCSVTNREVLLWDVTDGLPKPLNREVQTSFKSLLKTARDELGWALTNVSIKSDDGKLWQQRAAKIVAEIEARLDA